MTNLADTLWRKAAPLEADFIHAVGVNVACCGSHGKRQHMLRDGCAAPNIGMCSNPHVLMYRAQRAHHGPFFDRHMPRESRAIDQHGVVSDNRIVPNMRIRHDQGVAAHLGHASAFYRASIDRHALANFVVVANFQPCGLALVSDVLRRHANRAKRKEDVSYTDFRRSFDSYVRNKTAVLSEFYVWSDHAIRTNLAGWGNHRSRIDDGGGMNVHWIE